MPAPRAHDYAREPFLVVFKEETPIKETYAGEVGTIVLEGHRLKPAGRDGSPPSPHVRRRRFAKASGLPADSSRFHCGENALGVST